MIPVLQAHSVLGWSDPDFVRDPSQWHLWVFVLGSFLLQGVAISAPLIISTRRAPTGGKSFIKNKYPPGSAPWVAGHRAVYRLAHLSALVPAAMTIVALLGILGVFPMFLTISVVSFFVVVTAILSLLVRWQFDRAAERFVPAWYPPAGYWPPPTLPAAPPERPWWQRRSTLLTLAGVLLLGAASVLIPPPMQYRKPTERRLPFTGLDFAEGVAVDAAGAVYVADSSNNRVLKLPAGSGSQQVLPFTGLNGHGLCR